MNPSSPKFSSYHQSREMQVLRSIDVKPDSSSQSKSPEVQQLHMRLLMLSIEIDRKDTIIRELLMATNNNQYEIEIEQFSMRCQKYEVEIKTLNETIQMLKENISVIESTKNREVFNSVNQQFNEQLENKVYALEGKLRKIEDENIGLEEQLKQARLTQSMNEYKFIRDGQNEKGRVRELENMLITERSRAETERKVLIEKSNSIVEELKNKLIQCEMNEKLMIQQYEEKLRMYHNELELQENMKKSQIVVSEGKVSASAQEIHRLSEENKYLKQCLEAQRENIRSKDREFSKVVTQNKMVETKCIRFEGELKEVTIRFESKLQELRLREKQISQKESLIKKLYSEAEEMKCYFNNKNQEMQIYTQEMNRLKEEVSELYHQNDMQKNEIRKLKRKPISQAVLCESCRLKETGSTTLIASQKSIRALNIQQIIQQTEQLFRSNRKIQNLITKREPGVQSSIHLYSEHAYQN